MPKPIFVLDIGPDGGVASHAFRTELPVLVAPIPKDQRPANFNTVRQPLVAIGCMIMPDSGFEFDSSFIGPNTKAFKAFAKFMKRLRNQDQQLPLRFPPCSVFGHADPVGSDSYNKTLSGRRALSVYAVLVRNTKIWDTLFNIPFGGDKWGLQAIQRILSISLETLPSGDPEPPFYTGPIDGGKTPETLALTRQAIGNYLVSRGFARSGFPNQAARDVMFKEYMDALVGDDGFVLDPETDFIGKHKDKDVFPADDPCGPFGLKGDVQGCSEFNPIFLLAKEPQLSDEDRNDQNAPNRRVIVYVFKHGTEIDPKAWPCPRARDGISDCQKRFWSDHEKRRGSHPSRDRKFGENMQILSVDGANNLVVQQVEETGNTMACRFYHAFAVNSPCEVKLKEWVIRFKIDALKGGQPEVLANRRYVLQLGETEFAPVIRDSTDDFGFARIPVLDEQTKMLIKIDAGELLVEGTASQGAQGAGGGSQTQAAPTAASTAAASDTPPDRGHDPEAFPDEDEFWPVVLDGGALRIRDTNDDLAVKQRLYNLGFGEHAPDKFTDDEFQFAFQQYKHKRNLDSQDDNTVKQALFKEHEISGKPAPPSDDATASQVGSANRGSGDSTGS